MAGLQELPDGGRKSVIVDDTPSLLLRIGDQYFCVEDVCTHDGQPLTEGPVSGGQISCPRHGARFDLKTGAPTCMPATEPIRTFAVELRADGVYASPD
jgi:3-phenylpropionate/trans-cinnamate dioxygenase ferredoxin subunit